MEVLCKHVRTLVDRYGTCIHDLREIKRIANLELEGAEVDLVWFYKESV